MGEGWGEGGDINLFPLPSIPPAKGGENFREIGETFGKAKRKDSAD
jgi:hypothetical protein